MFKKTLKLFTSLVQPIFVVEDSIIIIKVEVNFHLQDGFHQRMLQGFRMNLRNRTEMIIFDHFWSD